jgi:predicted DNA-binding protein (MmcQ/YjbR family)
MRWGQIRKAVNVKDWELMTEHSQYSPDIAPSDFLSSAQWKKLYEEEYISDEEVVGAVQNRLKTQQKNLKLFIQRN